MNFTNFKKSKNLSHTEFVSLVWEEAEKNTPNWCNLTKAEQIELYCKKYEEFLSADWEKVSKIFIVQSSEEELGEELFKVTVPENEPREKVFINMNMAAKYAEPGIEDEYEKNEEGIAALDEHYPEMMEYARELCGLERFNLYLTEFCGYKVEAIEYDFSYEW